jgi:hypothetical protein
MITSGIRFAESGRADCSYRKSTHEVQASAAIRIEMHDKYQASPPSMAGETGSLLNGSGDQPQELRVVFIEFYSGIVPVHRHHQFVIQIDPQIG